VLVHLAGAGIADERWSKKRKQEILESRTKSTALVGAEIK
jgi:NAD dependent epimerase/dehydratase family enzyme